ncbi:unnamed protein product [Clonostachys solani]|uniref:Prolyl endopeptidase n=1 Tax=Clonostachys solani TaxID=160281 RepID=A0A9N9ZLK6_9HYPO|nr:unnamed protein product [Clonostachys solani]
MSSPDLQKWDWLEAQTAPECLAWVDGKNENSKAQLDSFSRFEQIHEQLQKLSESSFPTPEFCLLRDLFRIRKDSGHKYGIFEVSKFRADGTLGDWELVLDIGQLRETEGRSWEIQGNPFLRQSILHLDNSSRILLRFSEGGSDLTEIREFDLKARSFVSNGFNAEPDRAIATWIDIDHVLIAHGLHGAPKASTGWPLDAFIWTRGTELTNAKRVFSGSSRDAMVLIGSVGLGELQRSLILRIMDYSHREYHLLESDGTVHKLALPETIKLETVSSHTTSTHLVALLNEETVILGKTVPPGTVIAYDLTNSLPAEQRTTIVYTPEANEFNIKSTLDGLVAGYSTVNMILAKLGKERRLVLKFEDGDWKTVKSIPSSPGASVGLSASDIHSDCLVMTESGLLSPTRAWLESLDGKQQLLFSHPASFDASGFNVSQQSATSKDGTSIDFCLLLPKKTDGPISILMTGYAAFGSTLPLDYLHPMFGGTSLVPWLEAGGGLVVTFARGGSDRGESWHQQAMKENRQKSYDDFIAVAEKLVTDGHSQPDRLGFFGRSNGGLLAAVMGTQRPDLFGAIVSDVPMTDMLRYPKMGMGAAWVDEYGDPEDPNMEEALLKYSPFHNVREDVKYPPFLITVSTTDDRVGAGHARKLAARLQEVGAPVLFYEDREGGHGVSDSLSSTTLLSRRLAFLMDTLMGRSDG